MDRYNDKDNCIVVLDYETFRRRLIHDLMLAKREVKLVLANKDEEILDSCRVVENSSVNLSLILVERKQKVGIKKQAENGKVTIWLYLILSGVLCFFLHEKIPVDAFSNLLTFILSIFFLSLFLLHDGSSDNRVKYANAFSLFNNRCKVIPENDYQSYYSLENTILIDSRICYVSCTLRGNGIMKCNYLRISNHRIINDLSTDYDVIYENAI